eukprot:3010272-Rhodomonas_salina.1
MRQAGGGSGRGGRWRFGGRREDGSTGREEGRGKKGEREEILWSGARHPFSAHTPPLLQQSIPLHLPHSFSPCRLSHFLPSSLSPSLILPPGSIEQQNSSKRKRDQGKVGRERDRETERERKRENSTECNVGSSSKDAEDHGKQRSEPSHP